MVKKERNFMRICIGNINDKRPPKYECSVCSNIGLSTDRSDKSNYSFEICRYCGYSWGTDIDKKAWLDSWQQCGSMVLFDLPLEERREYLDMVSRKYWQHFYHLPDEEEINSLILDDRTYHQNGFSDFYTPNKKVVVRTEENEKCFDFETNKIHKISEDGLYFAVVMKDEHIYLLLSHRFKYNNKTLRWAIMGLTPDVFYFAMFLDEGCEVYDDNGIKYLFSIESAK